MADAPALTDRLRARLVDAVGAEHVLVAPELRAGYEHDWTRRFGAGARAVVRPGSADEVAAVVERCAAAGVPIVPQGGNTGLVGGGVPRAGEVVLSLRRLARVGEVDPRARAVDVAAGATLAAVATAAGRVGLEVGVDLASRDGATIGGMVATDAGGIHVLGRGRMREQVLALDAVGAEGRPLAGAPVDELAGSEGTLAILTGVRLRLVPRLEGIALAAVACADPETAVAIVGRVRRRIASLVAAELMLADGLELAGRHLGVRLPFAATPPVTLLLECQAVRDPLDELAGALDGTGADEVVVAGDAPDRRRLWALRESHAEAIATLGIPHKLDVRVPDATLPAFLRELGAAVTDASPGARTIVFGHVGVGNLHVNVVGPPPGDEAVDEAVLRLVARCEGDVVGEHGAGIAKARWLRLSRPDDELARIAERKHRYDPAGILNPGVVAGARIPPLPSAR